MVILNSIDPEKHSLLDLEKNASPYVYLVDNEQKMMLILKRGLDEMESHNSEDEPSSIQQYVTSKVQNLLDRISGNGPLSYREMEVLNYAALGKSNKQIARVMGLSESTVKNHFSSTLRKLHANDRTHAVTLALCNGWLDTGSISNGLVNAGATAGATADY
jgi:DNA-binding CsgD family transcriptional regulator